MIAATRQRLAAKGRPGPPDASAVSRLLSICRRGRSASKMPTIRLDDASMDSPDVGE